MLKTGPWGHCILEATQPGRGVMEATQPGGGNGGRTERQVGCAWKVTSQTHWWSEWRAWWGTN